MDTWKKWIQRLTAVFFLTNSAKLLVYVLSDWEGVKDVIVNFSG